MQIEEEKIDQLLDIINLYPSISIMHFSEGSHLLSKKIVQLCQQHSYEYLLNCVSDVCYEKSMTKYADKSDVKIKRFHLARPRYTIQPKACDYLFVTCNIEESEIKSFLQKIYATIKNAGLILIFIPKGDLKQKHLWSEELVENNFVATNTLDDIFKHYDVIISKKMHGWGG